MALLPICACVAFVANSGHAHPPPEYPGSLCIDHKSYDRIALSADGKVVATLKRGAVSFHGSTSGKPTWVALSSQIKGDERYLAFTPDGKHVLTRTCRIFEFGARPQEQAFRIDAWDVGTAKRALSIDLPRLQGANPDWIMVGGRALVALGVNEAGAAYSLDTGKEVCKLRDDRRATACSLSQNGKWLLVATKDMELLLWELPKGGLPVEVTTHHAKIAAVAVSPDGRYCAAATEMRPRIVFLSVFDRDKGKDSASTNAALFTCERLLFTPDGKTLVAAGNGLNHGLAVWDWRKLKEPRGGAPESGMELMKAAREFWDLRERQAEPTMSADGRWLATRQGGVRLWDLRPTWPLHAPREIREPAGKPGGK